MPLNAMAQLVLMAAQLFCGSTPARVIGPFVAPLIPVSPPNIIMFVSWCVFLKMSKYAWVAKYRTSTKTLLKSALMFYYLTAIPLYFLLIWLACKGANMVY